MGTPVPTLASALTIDVTRDLKSLSDLKNLMASDANVVLHLGSDLEKLMGQPVSAAVGKSTPALSLTASPSWKAGPVTFSLTPKASCTITIATKGETFKAATKVDDPASTTDVQLPAPTGMTYVNIDLDFDLKGEFAGSGTVDGLTISGKTCGSETTTLCFCQPVPSETEVLDALKMALSSLVFPTTPDSLLRMVVGSSCRMNFDGALNWELDLSYGLADYKLSAPSAALVQQSVKKAVGTLTLPSGEIKAGATASVKYAHTDHFGMVLERPDVDSALLYLVRSAGDESDETAGLSVGITATPASVKVDPALVEQAVQTVTRSAALASKVSSVVASQADSLQTSALTKLKKKIVDGDDNAGLSLALSQQTGRTVLFNYKADLSQPAIVTQSWKDLLTRNISDAREIGGFTLLPGSGVGAQLKKATTLQFQFFNLYKFTGETDFFDNCSCELAPDGSIRLISDIGIEGAVTTKDTVDKMRFYFSATASENAQGVLSGADIDLEVEISEKGDPDGAIAMAKMLGFLKQSSLQPAIDAMTAYAHGNSGTACLKATLKRSGYSRLACSRYSGSNPPRDRTRDQANWEQIHAAAVSLMDSDFVKPWTYSDWARFNSYCNSGDPDSVPNRKHAGNWSSPQNLPPAFWKGYQPNVVNYFLRATADGMNLFEDLVTLATDLDNVTTDAQWQKVQQRVTSIVHGDANFDYAKPIAGAILATAAQGGASVSASTTQAKDSFTVTLTVSA